MGIGQAAAAAAGNKGNLEVEVVAEDKAVGNKVVEGNLEVEGAEHSPVEGNPEVEAAAHKEHKVGSTLW